MDKRYSPTALVLGLIDIIVGIAEILIALRIILKLFGANADASFVNWVYETTQPLLQPFIGMFPAPVIDGAFVVEFSALFALIVYALAAFLIKELVAYIGYYSEKRSPKK